jgi:RNA polymerase sigma-70 factor (ECF subfamily)
LSLVAAATPDPDRDSITELLKQISGGDREAQARLIDRVYGELRRLAASYMRRERADHSIQPTALVHEAFLRLAQQPKMDWQDRGHFFAVASQAMRRILVDYARARQAEKRGGDAERVTFDEALGASGDRTVDILAVHEALNRLEKLSPRQCRVVELHFFAGLSFEEIAQILDVAERTVKRDWAFARSWLHSQLDS